VEVDKTVKSLLVSDDFVARARTNLNSEIDYPCAVFSKQFTSYWFTWLEYAYDWEFIRKIALIHKSSQVGFSCLSPDPVNYWKSLCGHEASFAIDTAATSDEWEKKLDDFGENLSCSLRLVSTRFIIWGGSSWIIYCDTADDLIILASDNADVSRQIIHPELKDVDWAAVYWRSKEFKYSDQCIQKTLIKLRSQKA
jgi:hypothetical protein